MNILMLCVIPVVLLLASWGFGSMVAAIGKVRGWNTKRAVWVSVIVYALSMIGVYLVGWYANDMLHARYAANLTYGLIIALIIIGIVFSPLINLALKGKYPDAFKKSTSSQATPAPNAQVAIEKEPALQKQRPISSGSDLQSQAKPDATPVIHDTTHSGHIFVSYRRSDSADVAGRIYDRLIGKFGKGPIFKDVDSIPLGLDFKEYLDKKVGECDVLLAIIGDRWLNASDSTGKNRLEDPADFVRIEIQSALERGIPVIPLLVRGAQMPSEESLPSSLRKLVYRNGIPIRSDPDFHRDMDRLITALEKYI